MADVDPSITLEKALAYKNDNIPYRFMDEWDVTLDEARLLFEDVKRYLWVNFQTGGKFVFVGPLGVIDDMYHIFILFTKEYAQYCQDVYGRFMHHFPITHEQSEQQRREEAEDLEGVRQRTLASRDWQRRVIAEKLGVDVLIRWYVDYPTKYGDEFFRTKRKPHRTFWYPDPAVRELAEQLRGAGADDSAPAEQGDGVDPDARTATVGR